MNKQTFSLLAAFLLFAVVAHAQNGGIISITDTSSSDSGLTGSIQCKNSTTSDAQIATTWKVRPKGSTTDWNSTALKTYKMGDFARLLYTGSKYAYFEVKFFPPPNYTFTPTDTTIVKVSFHKTTVITIHYP